MPSLCLPRQRRKRNRGTNGTVVVVNDISPTICIESQTLSSGVGNGGSMIRVYIASPITKPDPFSNALIAIAVADELMMHGFAPYVPQLSVFQEKYGRFDTSGYGEDYERFMQLDFEWLSQCDILLRLPGFSLGADREVEFAIFNGLTIFYDINALLLYKETLCTI